MLLRRSLTPPADLRVTTSPHRVARRNSSLKSPGPRSPEGTLRSCASLRCYFGRLLVGPRQGGRPRPAIDRKMRFTPARLRAPGLANVCRPTWPVETPERHEITSTPESWNVQSNQGHSSKRGARP